MRRPDDLPKLQAQHLGRLPARDHPLHLAPERLSHENLRAAITKQIFNPNAAGYVRRAVRQKNFVVGGLSPRRRADSGLRLDYLWRRRR